MKIHALHHALKSSDSLIIHANGKCERRWRITQFFLRLFGLEEKTECQTAATLEKLLFRNKENISYEEAAKTVLLMKKRLLRFYKKKDSQEKTHLLSQMTPLLQYQIDKDAREKAFCHRIGTLKRKVTKQTKKTIKREIEKEKKLFYQEEQNIPLPPALEQLSELKKNFATLDKNETPAQKWGFQLEQHLLSLKYNSLEQPEPVDEAVAQENFAYLKANLILWKERQFPPLEKGFSETEKRKLEEACRYKGFVELLKKSPSIKQEFFRFLFRNLRAHGEDSVSIFAQFPHIAERLSQCFLDKRVGTIQNKGLILEKGEVKLLIGGKYVSLHNESQLITFEDGSQFTLKAILDAFTKKDDTGEFEYYEKGILHSLPRDMPLKLEDKDNWWKDIPTFRTLSKQQAEDKYGIRLKKGQPLVTFMGSRQTRKELNVDNTHAWIEILLPKEDGSYSLLPLGKVPYGHPNNMLSALFFIFTTNKAMIGVDRDLFYTHREKTGFSVPLNQTQLKRCLEAIRQDMLDMRNGAQPFQIQGNNCGEWVQDIFEKTCYDHHFFKDREIPKLYEMEILDAATPYPVCYLSKCFKWISDNIHPAIANVFRVFISVFCGATWRYSYRDRETNTIKRSSLAGNKNWRHGKIHLPCKIFDNIDLLRRRHLRHLALSPA